MIEPTSPNSWTGACLNKEHRRSGWQRKLVVEHPLINQMSSRARRAPAVTVVFCLLCGRFWPSRAKYVAGLPFLNASDIAMNRDHADFLAKAKIALGWHAGSYRSDEGDWVFAKVLRLESESAMLADILAALGLPADAQLKDALARIRRLRTMRVVPPGVLGGD